MMDFNGTLLRRIDEPRRHVDLIALPSSEELQVWKEMTEIVESGNEVHLDDASAVDALEFANRYLCAREGFVALYLRRQHSQLDPLDRICVEECLKITAVIIAEDIRIQVENENECIFMDTLGLLFDKDNKYYEEMEGKIVRLRVIDAFQTRGGFLHVAKYLSSCNFPLIRTFEFLGRLVDAAWTLIDPDEPHLDFTFEPSERHEDVILVKNTILDMIRKISLENLEHEPLDAFEHVLDGPALLLPSSREDFETWYRVNCKLTLRLFMSESDKLKDLGWRQTMSLLGYVKARSPPARTVTVSKAGCAIFNGVYSFVGPVGEDGYVDSTAVILYKRLIPSTGKLLTIAPQKTVDGRRWTLSSKAEMDLSGTKTNSVVYYEVDSNSRMRPPMDGWKPSDSTGTSPPPTLRCHGSIVPPGQEYNTFEHRHAKWILSNRVLELALCENRSSEWASGTHLMKFVARVGSKSTKRNDSYLEASHVLMVWNTCLSTDDPEIYDNLCHSLAYVFPCLPDAVALKLLGALHDGISECHKLVCFCLSLIHYQEDAELGMTNTWLSSEVQTELQKLVWRIRCWEQRDGAPDEDYEYTDHEAWIKFEILCSTSRKHAGQGITQNALLTVPRNATVAVLDHGSRQIRVSMPIESCSGEYVVGMQVFATLDDDKSKELTVATVDQDAVERCIMEGSDKLSVEVVLPGNGLWNIEWHGLLLRASYVKTPRSTTTCVDLTKHVVAQEKQRRAAIDSMDEKAKRDAGGIQSVLHKLRGPCSKQMDAESKYKMLETTVERGHSTLKNLQSLIRANGIDETSASGLARLKDALATALPTKTELEASLKIRVKKHSAKGFKAHLTALVESGEAAAWMEKVTADDLESLGADSNRLFQLLVEGKGSKASSLELDVSTLEAASVRCDLFSRKQVKTLANRKVEMQAKASKGAQHGMAGMEAQRTPNIQAASSKAAVLTPERREPISRCLELPTFETPQIMEVAGESQLDIPTPVTPAARELDDALLSFLQEQTTSINGSPEAFYRWLVNVQDVTSLDGLADAVADNVYLSEVLQAGDGTVGIKNFMCANFKDSVFVASNRESMDENKENYDPCPDLVCPISLVLMTNDPVLAADGHTYERAAIEAWFEKQNTEIHVAQQELSSGSPQAKAIVERGVLSPMTQEQMDNLVLSPNKVVRTMARNAAAAGSNKRVPFGRIA